MNRLPGLVVDLFAGGGGASTGIEQAIGRPVDLAINHDPAAVQMHAANHPGTEHRCESIYDVDPVQATKGQPVSLLWASPSCTHFSRARGGTPVSKQLRGLGWQVLKWAGKVRPSVMIFENVAEWQTWGPVRQGRPWTRRKGAHWKLFLASLERLGYTVSYQVLDAADYGAPTHRRRLFLVARCDGMPPVVALAPTHGPHGSRPYRTAAECIDWSNLGHSIFDRKKPLAPATCRRIAAGIVKYVLGGSPFIVPGNPRRIIPQNYSGTIAAFLAKHYSGVVGQPCDRPLGTVTAVDHHSLVAAHLTTIDQQSNRAGHMPMGAPISTITHKARHALCAAFLTTYYSGGDQANRVDEPVPAIVTKARHGLVTVEIDGCTYALTDIRLRMLKPGELAQAQGFPAGYVLTGTQAQQIGRIGNSVCPPVARALVIANQPATRAETA